MWRRDDTGSVAVEAALAAPALFLMLMLVIFSGRVMDAKQQVLSAADAGARAASLTGDPITAGAAAQAAAEDNLTDGGISCTPSDVEVDTSNLQPSGSVTVTVHCTTDLSGVALPGIDTSQTFTESATEVVDRFRGGG